MDPAYGPDAAAGKCGVPAATIRRIARELAEAAFDQAITLDVPWTDADGRRHETMTGRPVSMHAMRGISAHSNGFDTCRAIHLLQMLLGAVDTPGAFRFKPPFPKPIPPGPKPSGKNVAPMTPLAGPPLGNPTGPEDLLLQPDGSPMRIDKAYSWEAPIAAHGMMHMVITNAYRGDPYPIDTLFMFMANMSWNSAMNTSETIRMLTDIDPATGEYRIPHIIYSDAFDSEMVAYADLVLPDTTYLERWDCLSLLDRPISDGESLADGIRHPVVQPDRDVRPFQDVLLDLGARLGLPGMVREDGGARYPGGYADYIVNHERTPGIGPLAGWRGADGGSVGRGAPNPGQLDAYVANGAFWRHELPASQRYFRYANREYLDWAHGIGLIPTAAPIVLQLYSEILQKYRLAAQGHGAIQPPEHLRARVVENFDPLPDWREPLEGTLVDGAQFPLHAITQRPMIMYHSWHTQNAWLRQIIGRNDLYVATSTARALGLADGDWAWVVSHVGRIKVRVRTMDGVQADTVWTWNAIGKRSGAWNLAPDAPEAKQGFLLNHLISELLPHDMNQRRFANADPVTGQAAWYDLRVRVEKCAAEECSGLVAPQFAELAAPPGIPDPPRVNRFGEAFRPAGATGRVDAMTSIPENTGGKALGLLIDLDTCVGCHACVTACKGYNSVSAAGPLSDINAYQAEQRGTWFNRVFSYEVDDGAAGRTVHFPKNCLHCEKPDCVTVCPTGASYKRAEDGIVLIDTDICIGCKLCAWACPYGAREVDEDEGVMRKCTLCVDKIYDERLSERDRQPACVTTCPTGARHFGDFKDPDSKVSRLVRERGGIDLMPETGYRPVSKYLPPRPRTAPDREPAREAPGTAAANGFLRWVDRVLTR